MFIVYVGDVFWKFKMCLEEHKNINVNKRQYEKAIAISTSASSPGFSVFKIMKN